MGRCKVIKEFDDIVEYLLDNGWTQYTAYDTKVGCQDFYKVFPTPHGCRGTGNPGIEITCRVQRFMDVTVFSFTLQGETVNGGFKLSRYDLTDDFAEAIKVTNDMVALWEIANIPRVG